MFYLLNKLLGYHLKSIKVSGEVVHPGVVSMTNKRQSIKELIEKAGGLTPFASLKSSYIMREGTYL